MHLVSLFGIVLLPLCPVFQQVGIQLPFVAVDGRAGFLAAASSQFGCGEGNDAFERTAVCPSVFAMQIQALGAGVVAIGGRFVAPNVLLGLERGLRQIAVGIEVFAADADVKQVLFDVFQQTGVVVMLLQGLVHAGGFVAA